MIMIRPPQPVNLSLITLIKDSHLFSSFYAQKFVDIMFTSFNLMLYTNKVAIGKTKGKDHV